MEEPEYTQEQIRAVNDLNQAITTCRQAGLVLAVDGDRMGIRLLKTDVCGHTGDMDEARTSTFSESEPFATSKVADYNFIPLPLANAKPRYQFRVLTLSRYTPDGRYWGRFTFREQADDILTALKDIEFYKNQEGVEGIRLEVRDAITSDILERLDDAEIDVASLKADYA